MKRELFYFLNFFVKLKLWQTFESYIMTGFLRFLQPNDLHAFRSKNRKGHFV